MSPKLEEIALPHFEDRLSEELARLHHERQAGGAGAGVPTGEWRRPRPRYWRPLVAGIAVLAMAAGAVAFDAARGSGNRSAGDRGDGSPGAPTSPAGGGAPEVRLSVEELVARVREATAALPDDAVIHEVQPIRNFPDALVIEEDGETGELLDVETGEPVEPGPVVGYQETWYDRVTGASRTRLTTRDGEAVGESGWPEAPTVDEAPPPGVEAPSDPVVGRCDPSSGLEIDENGDLHPCDPPQPVPVQPTHAVRMVDHCRRAYGDTVGPVVQHPGFGYIELFLGLGDLVVDGTQEVDGRELLRIRNQGGTYEMLVDPESYLPLRVTLTGETTEYDYLPRTAENLELLSPRVPDGYDEVPIGELQAQVTEYLENPSCD